MKLKTFSLSGFGSLILKIVMLSGVLLTSCTKENLHIPSNIASVKFASSTYTIEKNNTDEFKITLPLSLPLEEDGTVVIKILDESTADASNFSTNPGATSSSVTLNLMKDAIEASFTVKSVNNFADDKTIKFEITSATGGIRLAKDGLSTLVTMKGNNPTTPEITSSLISLEDFGLIDNGSTSGSKSYTISARNLTQNIAVAASANFKVSLDNVTFSNSLSIDFNTVNNSSVEIFVKFAPITGDNQAITGVISHSSTGVDLGVGVSGQEDGNSSSVVIANEDFDYGNSSASLTAVSTWEATSATGLTPVTYITPGLTFPGYPTVGGAVTMQNGTGSREDIKKNIDEQSAGIIYTSQLVRISAAGTGDFFLSLLDASGGFFNRIYAKDNNGSLSLGLGRNTSPEYSATPFSYQTTYLIVTKYNFTTQVSSMYVLSGTPPAIEPSEPAVIASAGAVPASFKSISIRQNSGILNATIDGIRIATSWRSAVGL